MFTVHLVYGLSDARIQFVKLINEGAWHRDLGFDLDHIPVFTDQLVPNISEQSPTVMKKKVDTMMEITQSWPDPTRRRAILEHIQEVLTKHLITSAEQHAPEYLPTGQPYRQWENIRNQSQMIEKTNDFFSRKCKTGLRMPHGQVSTEFTLGDTIFLVNGLDMVAIVRKTDAVKSIITFRELRSTFRTEMDATRAGQSNRELPVFARILHTGNGNPVRVVRAPAPWSEDWLEHMTSSQFQAMGGSSSLPREVAEKFYVMRGADLWQVYAQRRGA